MKKLKRTIAILFILSSFCLCTMLDSSAKEEDCKSVKLTRFTAEVNKQSKM